MKVLLDENVPHQVRRELEGHDIFTVRHMGWAGVFNGELMALAASQTFDLFITCDRGLEYQQNEYVRPIGVIILMVRTNTIESIRPLYPAIQVALASMKPRELIKIAPPT